MRIMCWKTVMVDKQCPNEHLAIIRTRALKNIRRQIRVMLKCGGKKDGKIKSYSDDPLEYPDATYLKFYQNMEVDFLTLLRARRKGIKIEKPSFSFSD